MINFKIASLDDAKFEVAVPQLDLAAINQIKRLHFQNTTFVVCQCEGDQHEFRRGVYACELIRRYYPDSLIVVAEKLTPVRSSNLCVTSRALQKAITCINAKLDAIAKERGI